MNKRAASIITLCGYIATGCLTALVMHWLRGDGFFEPFMIGFTMAIAIDVANEKYNH